MVEVIDPPKLTKKNTVNTFDPTASNIKVIVVGSGPVGLRFAQELLRRLPQAEVTLFGNEPYQPYNRVQLSALLAGDIHYEDILSPLPSTQQYPGFKNKICAIRSINAKAQAVVDAEGHSHHYDKLIIATGSRPHVPSIPGVDQTGVYTFRNLKDAEALYTRANRARHVLVVGGGLLGLEAARALLRQNTQVTLVQQGQRLMNRQLDDRAAQILQQKIESLGINVITNSGIRKILGEGRVIGATTRDGQVIECDTILLCAGIKANVELARNAKIVVAKGIVVGDQLQTSAENIYAIGECCEHRGLTYGLVNPGFEQAAIAAEIIASGKSNYVGSLEISQLKVVGEEVCSMGTVADLPQNPFQKELSYTDKKRGIYRKIVLYKGKLIGAAGVGAWPESKRVQEAYQTGRKVRLWQQLCFQFTGKLWAFSDGQSVASWPRTATICQCNNITQGTLVDALSQGCQSVSELQQATGAGTVCGSCKPLLGELCGTPANSEKEKAWLPTLAGSLIALVVFGFLVFLPPLVVANSVLEQDALEKIWNDKYWKQVTGFSLLGMSVIGLLMSLKKRLGLQKFGDYTWWRTLHVFLGLMCAGILILHTGLHFGANLNRMLMLDFLAIIFLGSLAGAVVSLSHTLSLNAAKQLRAFWTWGHILLTWPLPILLGTHIFTVYYF